MKKILFIVDPQNDFVDGTLPVPHAKEIMSDAARYINVYGDEYEFIVVSCDFHPVNHCSFNNQGGEWPMHCIEHSVGAAVFPPIADALVNYKVKDKRKVIFYLTKGKTSYKEEYSAVDSEENVKQFMEWLDVFDIHQIDIFGIAGDVCVKSTIEGLIELGLKENICVMQDFCPSIDDGTTLKTLIEKNNLKIK